MVEPRLLTVRDAAVYMAISQRTVRRMMADGTLAIVRIGGRVLIEKQELDSAPMMYPFESDADFYHRCADPDR